ncbi:Art7 [Symbiodinium sp. CCMP2592]|nr:Art7 [Symbiodinium sp. CCMP2592]
MTQTVHGLPDVGSQGIWLDLEDFVSCDDKLQEDDLRSLSFPSNWPAAYQSDALRALIGKRGRLPGKRVAVAGAPSPAEQVAGVTCYPLQSFSNAEQLSAKSRLGLVRGWAVYERGDRPGRFVAERYWWNCHPDGRWVDLTPRPEGLQELLLVEADGSEKQRGALTSVQVDFARRLLTWRFPKLAASIAAAAAVGRPAEPAQPQPAKPVQPSQPAPSRQTAKVLDYSKWSNIVDSDEEEAPQRREDEADVGVKDLAEGKTKKKPVLPVPDFLQGSTAGGGGTNCLLSLLKLLDAEEKKEDHAHSLAQVFGRSFHSGMLDRPRQSFYKRALTSLDKDVFVVVLGIGSVLPLLEAARSFHGILLETSTKLAEVAEHLLKANKLNFPVAVIKEGLDNAEAVRDTISRKLPKAASVCVVTERMAHDLLSNGIVPACVTVHQALRNCGAKSIRHLPKTVELLAAPAEIRSERLLEFDLRPFNTLRHTSSNDKADFWWWPVRMGSQPNTNCALLGPAKTLCGFDFDRSPEITLDEVRRPMKLQADKRGRCNCVAVWWVAKFGDEEYSTRPDLENRDAPPHGHSEWKQAVHYLAGETSVFQGDVIDLQVSVTPRFTFRMMQESPMSVEVPMWVQAPTSTKFSATLPILPYHFLMMTDMERAQVYQRAIRDAVQSQRKKLGRRPRVLDAGSGIGLLGMMAALEGAEVWLCEAVPLMRQTCREVVAANAALITEKRGMVNLLPPMMSTRLVVGEDVAEKFDIVVSEVMDLWCLGEGIIPTMRHAHKKLLAETGVMLPGRLQIFVQPLELSLWGQVEKENGGIDLQAIGQHFKSKFSAVRIDQFPRRYLTDEPIVAMEVNLSCVPPQPAEGEPNVENDVKLCIRMGGKAALRAKVSSVKVDHSGMLSGYGIWWSADLGNGHMVTSNPSSPQRSWKQLIRWLDAPRFVSAGEDIQVLTCYNDHQVNVEDIYLPREMVDKYQEELLAAQGQAAGGEQQKHSSAETEELIEVD